MLWAVRGLKHYSRFHGKWNASIFKCALNSSQKLSFCFDGESFRSLEADLLRFMKGFHTTRYNVCLIFGLRKSTSLLLAKSKRQIYQPPLSFNLHCSTNEWIETCAFVRFSVIFVNDSIKWHSSRGSCNFELVEFSNITLSVNPNCTRIYTITHAYYANRATLTVKNISFLFWTP